MGFTSLNHHLDIHWLLVAYWRTRKDGAAGVDGMTAEHYEANLKGNLSRFWTEPSPARTMRRPCDGCISRKELA